MQPATTEIHSFYGFLLGEAEKIKKSSLGMGCFICHDKQSDIYALEQEKSLLSNGSLQHCGLATRYSPSCGI